MNKENEIDMGSFFEIKRPIAHLESGDSETIWFYDYSDNIVCFDNIPFNYPRWVFTIHTFTEMIDAVKRMYFGGWDIIYIDDDLLEEIQNI